jgi:hypothetical protein
MPLDFPANPSPNDIYSFGDKTWIWTGQGWRLNSSGNLITVGIVDAIGNVTGGNINTANTVSGGNIVATGDLTVQGEITQDGITVPNQTQVLAYILAL